MADICTLISSTMTLVACMAAPVCDPAPVDGRVLCRPGIPVTPCNYAIDVYQCKREVGTTYTFTKPER